MSFIISSGKKPVFLTPSISIPHVSPAFSWCILNGITLHSLYTPVSIDELKSGSIFFPQNTLVNGPPFRFPKVPIAIPIERSIDLNMSKYIVDSFIESIRKIADDLLSTADLLADADVWVSLATVANTYSWVCPKITDDCAFDIVGGRHPVIESVLRTRGDNFVKNDCNLNAHSVALLTGPNMAGKSTYLRQNAIIVVLAHLGSFVPATTATIGICDQLFSRVGASDNLAAGQSTFMVEMAETANILNRATMRSFIIFDEIGRGTATYDGMAIAQAVLEYLDELQPRTLFATHYHELTALACGTSPMLSHVSCLTIDVREHNNEIVFMHKIVSGVANRSYGIHVARMAGMPSSVVARAQSVLDALESHDAPMSTPITPECPPHPVARKKPCVSDKQPPQLNLFDL